MREFKLFFCVFYSLLHYTPVISVLVCEWLYFNVFFTGNIDLYFYCYKITKQIHQNTSRKIWTIPKSRNNIGFKKTLQRCIKKYKVSTYYLVIARYLKIIPFICDYLYVFFGHFIFLIVIQNMCLGHQITR